MREIINLLIHLNLKADIILMLLIMIKRLLLKRKFFGHL